MNFRRHFAAPLTALLALWGVSLFVTELRGAPPERPNVLMIAVDDLNDWVEPLGGHPQAQTPAMDRLAARGTTFTNAHCQSPLCNPSRTSLMTGLRPSTTGVYGLAPWFRQIAEFKGLTTLPQHFKRHGYRTYTTGKIYHGGYPPRPQRTAEYDVWGPDASVGARPEEKLVVTPQGNHPLVDWGTFPHRDEDKGDWRVASWAVDQLEKMPEEEPFFMSVGFFLPHVPCYATQKWFDLYPDATLQMPPLQPSDRDDTPMFSWYLHWDLPEPRLRWLREANQWRPLVQSYLASISFVDSQIGRVLAALEASGHADDTIVVLWSDHGFHLGEKEISGKNTLWDDGTRVPLIFAGPGIRSGQASHRPAELLDIYPTLSELCGLPVGEQLEGLSLVPQLNDPMAPRERPAITTHNPDNHGVRSERWRYIRYADGSEELYDTQTDPNEWRNLAAAATTDPAIARVIAEHRRWLPESSRPPVPGSAHRILVREGDAWVWEGKPIDDAQLNR
ncbi:sulfatase [Candidatus Laterigemmans baculatus]|uniref:sulfatase n=1 Tax=Candidatus Laterigemmans baculatus TaxID=2770505 RepID=UPI0013DA91EE|nr:sulfatase [Candidatus Laterigemmans baculatus]